MGYGGAAGAAEHLGKVGDEGLDGVIRQDALGLDRIYVQAKRYGEANAVGRPEIQAFVGALHGAQADRGIFITTSRFTPEAITYADRVAARVVLIDGPALSGLMVRHNIGVQDQQNLCDQARRRGLLRRRLTLGLHNGRSASVRTRKSHRLAR